jgi:predicted dehydrogenase
MPEDAEVVAVASPTPGNAEAFARRHGIPAFHTDYVTCSAIRRSR